MEPKFQTSFIPKRPVMDNPKSALPVVKTTNIFSVAANLIFVLTLLASAGLFGYKYLLIKQITDADRQLNAAREAFEADKVEDLLDASTRITTTKNLLEKHFVVSEILVLMQQLTVKNMRFDEFNFKNKNGSPTLEMIGEGSTYNAIAEQSDTFNQNGFFKNQTFNDFSLTDTGTVRAKYLTNLSPELISYKKLIEDNSLDQ